MLNSSLIAGYRAVRARPGLAVLIYLINLAIALVLVVPLGVAFARAVGDTGFDAELAHGLDIVLLTDIFQQHGDFLATMFAQLVWILPLVFAWKTVVGIGLVDALRDGGGRSFWAGVGRYFGRGLLLGLLFLVPVGVWIVAMVIAGFVLTNIWTGEVATVNVWFILVPLTGLVGLSVADLMHDYGRVALVARERPVFASFTEGFLYPFRHGTAWIVYVLWLIPAAIFWLLPTVFEAAIGATLLVFLLQQVLLFGRAAATVGWFGSEVALYEGLEPAPAIAETTGTETATDPSMGPM